MIKKKFSCKCKTCLNTFRYVSCVLGCPYEGYVQPSKVAEVYILLYPYFETPFQMHHYTKIKFVSNLQIFCNAILYILHD